MNRKHLFILFSIIVATAVITRIIPYVFGFSPFFFQPVMAIGIFGISVFRKEKTAILIPLAALLLSDLAIEMLSPGSGFYEGQAFNYLCMGIALGFSYFFNSEKSAHITAAAVVVPFIFYVLSNSLMVFASHGGSSMYPKSLSGVFASLDAGFPFFLKDIYCTAFFCAVFFGVYRYLVARRLIKAWS
jgi:hypothetical protein